MGVKIRVSKKGKIIILASLVVLLAGSGGYLLWRVNQQNSLGSTNSEAGQSYNGTCWACCTASEFKSDSKGNKYCPGGSLCDSSVTCGDGVTIPKKSGVSDATACTNCYHSAPSSKTPVGGVQCNIGSQCTNTCYWPEVSYCNGDGTCTCKSGSSNGCTDSSPTCTPVCNGTSSTAECTAKCSGCNNAYTYKISCNVPTTNTCDSGTWITKPSGSYAYCDAITYSAVGTDSDGILTSSISVLLNSTSKTDYTLDSNSTSATISGTLSSTTSCLAAGSYTLKMSWSDSKGNTSTNCTLSTTFTVQPKQTNPNWSITKTVVESCINANTTNPSSQLTYAITVKNTGDGSGTLSKIVDTLDTKVLSTYISNISNSGSYADGKLTWTLSGTDATFASNQQKVYTYVVAVPKDTFGNYANSVTAYPTTGDSFSANASIDADCTIAPQTGLFDNTWTKIVVGILFILSGIYFNNINNFGRKLKILVKDHMEDERIKKFEKKVVKR